MKNKNIIVLGSGPCGLSTAYNLSLKNKNVNVYEARHQVGGLGGSETIDGMIFDYGPHIFHTHDEKLKKFWINHFGDLLTEKKFFSKNYKDGILYDYPLSYESIEKFPDKLRSKVKKELLERKPENIMRARNFKEVVIAIVGPTLQNIFFEGYSRKLWGIPTDQMSSKWAPKRIEIREKHSSFWHEQYSAAAIKGAGSVMNRMAEKIIQTGNKIFLNSKVVNFKTENSLITEIFFEDGSKIDSSKSLIVSTLPITAISRMLGYESKLQFNSYILAYVVAKKKQILPDGVQSIYFANDENYFHRVTEQKQYSNFSYPKNRTILCFEISYRTKPELLKKSPSDLCREVFKQFTDLGFCNFEVYEKGFARYFPSINPILYLGYEEELAKTNSIVSQYSNLYQVGGAAEFSYGDMQVMFLKSFDVVDLLTNPHYEINKNIKISAPFAFNKTVNIGNKIVGDNHPTLLLAEIGINHQGSKEMLIKLLNQVKEANFDYAKLQTYFSSRVSATSKGAKYADKTLDMEENISEMFERLQLSKRDHDKVFDWSKKNNFPVISTVFDEESVDFLIKYNLDAFKISSFDAVNLPLLKYVASKKKPIILSTGMCAMSEIEEALDAVASQDNKNLILLHCVSSYPCDPRDVNLNAITTMKNAFKLPVGYSDHTIGTIVAQGAIAMGANVVEKHFTLDKNLEGSDHILSADFNDLKLLSETRNILYTAFGSGIKKKSFSETSSVNTQRKSIYTGKKILAGQKITLDNICIKGPGHGLLPKYLNLVLGKKVTKNIEKDSPVTWDCLLK
jgi:sialic acid synthase SpsE/protoporphyrinogen oxidase